MDRKIHIEYWKTIEFMNKFLIAGILIETVCVAIMAIAFYRYIGWQKVVLVPPVIEKELMVAGANTSVEYLLEMNEFIAQQIMEYSPQNIQRRVDTVMRYVGPTYKTKIRSQLDKLKSDVMQTGLSQLFRLEDIRIKTDGFAYIAGNIDRHIVGKPFWKTECKLRIQFTMKDGRYSLIGLKLLMGPFDYKGKDAIYKGYNEVSTAKRK